MPKRKRGSDSSLTGKLEKLQDEVFRALKAAKGFERQRIAKRSRDAGITEDKKERLDRELSVLKSLDLHQTAKAHLYASLLKVKSIAASTDLPDEIRASVAKPELSPDEQAALHNVTSGLYNREPVKQAIDRAVAAVCDSLNLPVPEKAKRSRRNKDASKEEPETEPTHKDKKARKSEEPQEDSDDESEFQGFGSDVDEPGPAVGELESEDEAKEEAEFSKYDDLLGSSSDEGEEEEEEEDPEEAFFRKLRSQRQMKETANLNDISSGSESEAESVAEESDGSESPEPKKGTSKTKKEKAVAKEPKPVKSARDTTFLPSLMGGYISGSESASDVDVAPPKKRLGQRQRQAIAEKKYGDKARHVVNGTSRIQGGRDGGWDAKRGAVDSTDRRGGKPWKKGREPFGKQEDKGAQQEASAAPPKPPKPAKRDDTGPLHPSWEARKKAKEAQKAVEFKGSKVTFD
ncbi:hypothetical protein NLU13_9934 [Sarocladium strictum]|uniref:Bud22 domain-containing protein n=1 Tax=Sarocladium strictum TaxID=5046 RepID=A0AA39GA73_SARSR|nr:hypothetical protein NLU13_9934 [Sarocladium strictum]